MTLTDTKLTLAEAYKFTLTNGTIAYFTSHSENFTFLDDGPSYGTRNLYQAIPIRRSPIVYHSNLEVDTVTIDMGIVGIRVGTQLYTMPQVIRRELLRQAHVKIYLVDYRKIDSYGGVTSELILFEG